MTDVVAREWAAGMAQISPMRSASAALDAFGPTDLQLNRAVTSNNTADHVSNLRVSCQDLSRTASSFSLTKEKKERERNTCTSFLSAALKFVFICRQSLQRPSGGSPHSYLLWFYFLQVCLPAAAAPLRRKQWNPLKIYQAIRFLAPKIGAPSQYIYDFYLSINTSVSIVGVCCPASGLTRQWTLAFLKNTVIQPL